MADEMIRLAMQKDLDELREYVEEVVKPSESTSVTDFSDMTATDTSGFLGTANASVNAQILINSLMERIVALEALVGDATTRLSNL